MLIIMLTVKAFLMVSRLLKPTNHAKCQFSRRNFAVDFGITGYHPFTPVSNQAAGICDGNRLLISHLLLRPGHHPTTRGMPDKCLEELDVEGS